MTDPIDGWTFDAAGSRKDPPMYLTAEKGKQRLVMDADGVWFEDCGPSAPDEICAVVERLIAMWKEREAK